MMAYRIIHPCQGVDGRHYVAADYSDNFSAYHLDFERERGNLREVVFVREVQGEEEIEPGDLVTHGNSAKVWREVTPGF